MTRQRVLVVDDHAGFRRAVRRMLEAGGFEVVGEAADGREAIAGYDRHQPELMLIDVLLPDTDGFALARHLAALPRPPVVVLVSSRSPADLRAQLTSAPVRGFLTKEQLTADSLSALVGAQRGAQRGAQ